MSTDTATFSSTAAASIGEAVTSFMRDIATDGRRRTKSGAPHRTGRRIHRDSLEEGTFEDTFFVAPAPGEPDDLIRKAHKLADKGRELKRIESERKLTAVERPIAQMTPAAVRVFEELCHFSRLCAGRIYPSWEKLAELSVRSRSTVGRALNILEDLGLIVRQRRYKMVEDEGVRRFEQTSTAYRLSFPKALVSYLPRFLRPAPMPVDELQREAERQDDMRHMLGTLTLREFARVTVSSGPLAEVLARLGASIDARTPEVGASPIFGLHR